MKEFANWQTFLDTEGKSISLAPYYVGLRERCFTEAYIIRLLFPVLTCFSSSI